MAKLAVTFVFIICVISAGRYDAAGLSVYFFYPAVMIALGELPLWGMLRRTLPALPFVLFAGVSNMIFEPTLAPVGVSYGVLSCVVLLEKALLSVGAVVMLAAIGLAALVPFPAWVTVACLLLPIPLALVATRVATPRLEV